MATIFVTGFLGAGKSALAARLCAALPDRSVREAVGTAAPDDAIAGAAVVGVADAANLVACLDDRLLGPLVAAQLGVAGLVVLARTDLVSPAPALAALASVTGAPVVEIGPGDLPAGLAARIAALPPAPRPPATPPVAFAEWRYAGPAGLAPDALEALVADRPEGLYRLSGVVRCAGHGVEVELVGRLRQTRPVPLPAETALVATGPRARFRPDRMAHRFSEGVAARGWLSGLFGHR